MTVTPSQILKHIKRYLPKYTSLFTDFLTISSATMDANNVLTVTSLAHGKAPGDNIVISGGTTRNVLTAAVLEGATVKFTTTYGHDLIEPSQDNDDLTLTLSGFGSVWDGEHDIISVPNRENFNVPLPTGETLAPTLDGNQYLIYPVPGGAFAIDTVPTVDTFTIDLSAYPEQPQGAIDGLKIPGGFRISAAADYERAKALYSKIANDQPYLFLIMTDMDVAKDPYTLNDAVAGLTVQDERLLRLLQSFSTTVFIPTTDDLSGANAQELAFGTVQVALMYTLFCSEFETASSVKYLTVPVSNGSGEYNSSFYIHVYDWQLPMVINYSDGSLEIPESAFRDISQTSDINGDDQAQTENNTDLDDEPL